MIEALADQVELNSLLMTDNKQSWLNSARQRMNDGFASLQAGANGLATAAGLSTAPATTPTTSGDDTATGIKNRSPSTSTVNNTYPPPPAVAGKSDAPWIALIVIVLGLLTIAGLMWMASQPKPSPATTPTTTTKTPQGVQIPNMQWSASQFDPFAKQ